MFDTGVHMAISSAAAATSSLPRTPHMFFQMDSESALKEAFQTMAGDKGFIALEDLLFQLQTGPEPLSTNEVEEFTKRVEPFFTSKKTPNVDFNGFCEAMITLSKQEDNFTLKN